MLASIVLTGTVLLSGCSDETCGVEGTTQECACGSGVTGTQSCGADGAWSACECPEDDVGGNDAGADAAQSDDMEEDTGADSAMGTDTEAIDTGDLGEGDSGDGGDGEVLDCPTAVISIEEDADNLEPFTTIHLDGSASSSSAGAITRYEWVMTTAPVYLCRDFTPRDDASSVTYDLERLGQYVIELNVWDEDDRESCEPARLELDLASPADIPLYIEVAWEDATIGNPCESTMLEYGPDVDLHVTHPDAVGLDVDGDDSPDGWFDSQYDLSCFNPTVAWGAQLLRVDSGGLGPEAASFSSEAASGSYGIAVHLWDDGGYQTKAYVTVHCGGILRFTGNSGSDYLTSKDMWVIGIADPTDCSFEQQQSRIDNFDPGFTKD